MRVIDDASAETLNAFVTENVHLDATVITDGWSGYARLSKLGYSHEPHSQRAAKAHGEDIDRPLPGVHRIASLIKRWLLSTHRGAVKTDHLDDYLGEFSFRFNRRHSHARGCCSTASYNSPSATTRSATGRWSHTLCQRGCHRPHRTDEATRQAWTDPAPTDPGVEQTR